MSFSKKEKNIYNNRTWQALRKIVLAENPFCVQCLENDKHVKATVIDHILPVRLGGDFYDTNNLQGLCESCHNKKSAKESKLREKYKTIKR